MYERMWKVDKKDSLILLTVARHKEMRKDQKNKHFMYCCSFSLSDESGLRGLWLIKLKDSYPFDLSQEGNLKIAVMQVWRASEKPDILDLLIYFDTDVDFSVIFN